MKAWTRCPVLLDSYIISMIKWVGTLSKFHVRLIILPQWLNRPGSSSLFIMDQYRVFVNNSKWHAGQSVAVWAGNVSQQYDFTMIHSNTAYVNDCMAKCKTYQPSFIHLSHNAITYTHVIIYLSTYWCRLISWDGPGQTCTCWISSIHL